MRDIMLDLETLSLDSNCCIVSIGAVEFNAETGEVGREFSIKVNILEQVVNGAKVSEDTLKWWSEQSETAKRLLCSGKDVSVRFALEKLNEFITSSNHKISDMRLWGNGAGADNVWIRNLYKRHNVEFVLPFWCDCDVRTIASFMSMEDKKAIVFEGTKHNAIDYCKHQIKLITSGCRLMYNYFSKGL